MPDVIPGSPEADLSHKTKGSIAAPVAFSQLYHSTLYPNTRNLMYDTKVPKSHVKFAHYEREDVPHAVRAAPAVDFDESPSKYVGVDCSTTYAWKMGPFPHIHI